MENFKSLIVLNEIDFHAIQFHPKFEELLIDPQGDYVIISEKNNKLLEQVKFQEGKVKLNYVYLKNPLSQNEFYRDDTDFDIEKEYEHKLKMLFKILGATSFKRVLEENCEKNIDITIEGDLKSGINTKSPVHGFEAELVGKSLVKDDKIIIKENKSSEGYSFKGNLDISPLEKFKKAKDYAKNNNLLFFQDVRNLLESFNPSISENLISKYSIKTISFESISHIFKASLSLAAKCEMFLIKKGHGFGANTEVSLKFDLENKKKSQKIREIVVEFGSNGK